MKIKMILGDKAFVFGLTGSDHSSKARPVINDLFKKIYISDIRLTTQKQRIGIIGDNFR